MTFFFNIHVLDSMRSCPLYFRIKNHLSAVIGKPSFSFSIRTFFKATIFFGSVLLLALKTSPKVPCPILAIFSYLSACLWQYGKWNFSR